MVVTSAVLRVAAKRCASSAPLGVAAKRAYGIMVMVFPFPGWTDGSPATQTTTWPYLYPGEASLISQSHWKTPPVRSTGRVRVTRGPPFAAAHVLPPGPGHKVAMARRR